MKSLFAVNVIVDWWKLLFFFNNENWTGHELALIQKSSSIIGPNALLTTSWKRLGKWVHLAYQKQMILWCSFSSLIILNFLLISSPPFQIHCDKYSPDSVMCGEEVQNDGSGSSAITSSLSVLLALYFASKYLV